jgi:hypothetical protein
MLDAAGLRDVAGAFNGWILLILSPYESSILLTFSVTSSATFVSDE